MLAVEKPEGDQKPVRRLVSIKDAATQLGVSRSTIYNMHKLGGIRFGKVLGKTVVAQSEIDRLVDAAALGEVV